MSHLTKVKTKFKNLDTLKSTLESMGYIVQVGDLKVSMPWRIDGEQEMRVAATIRNEAEEKGGYGYRGNGKPYMGFQLNDGVYEFVGDTYGTRSNMDQIGRDATKKYAVNEVKRQFEINPDLANFNLASQKEVGGETVMTFQRWA